MTFSLTDIATEFEWPVDIKAPRKDGSFIKKSFTGRFTILDAETLDQFGKGVGGNQDDIEMCRRILVGWDEDSIRDENGNPVKYSETQRAAMLAVPFIRAGIIQSYYRAMSGRAREKN